MRSPLTVITLTLLGVSLLLSTAGSHAENLKFHHVHGLVYSSDGRLLVPIHDGLAVYAGDRWSRAPGPLHDYMGLAATRSRLYSSGHPAPRSELKDPFGLIVSTDHGEKWEKRGLEGEADFHVLAASYDTSVIYVHNSKPNSRMASAGIYYTLNEGFSWTRARSQGLSGRIQGIAVHPTDPKMVAVSTKEGLFLSTDGGDRFEHVGSGPAYAVLFELDGTQILYGAHDDAARLYRYALRDRKRIEVPLPALKNDAVAYIAQNPLYHQEYAIATLQRNIFVSKAGGAGWIQIAANGQPK